MNVIGMNTLKNILKENENEFNLISHYGTKLAKCVTWIKQVLDENPDHKIIVLSQVTKIGNAIAVFFVERGRFETLLAAIFFLHGIQKRSTCMMQTTI